MEPLRSACDVLHVLNAPEDVGAARRMVRELAFRSGAPEADIARAELIATELGTNTLTHAQRSGYLLIQPTPPVRGRGIEIVAVDRGPGIEGLSQVLQGVPSRFAERAPHQEPVPGRGLGCGLASVRRLASEFDAYSMPGQGTVVLARLLFEHPPQASALRVGAVSLPLPGEEENGDAWIYAAQPSGGVLLLCDGLGHGPEAARASAAAVALFRGQPPVNLANFLLEAHLALRGTRGAAVSVCRILTDAGVLQFAGFGNVEGRIHQRDGTVGLAPRNGTLGMNAQPPKVHVREVPWVRGATLTLHSDGLRHVFDLSEHERLADCDPTVIAAVLHRDLGRGRDDATVVVVQEPRAPR